MKPHFKRGPYNGHMGWRCYLSRTGHIFVGGETWQEADARMRELKDEKQ